MGVGRRIRSQVDRWVGSGSGFGSSGWGGFSRDGFCKDGFQMSKMGGMSGYKRWVWVLWNYGEEA